jgi:hypothetical protein
MSGATKHIGKEATTTETTHENKEYSFEIKIVEDIFNQLIQKGNSNS